MRTLVLTPGPTITGSHLRYRREASTRAGLIVGTTLEITTPVTTSSSKPRSSNSWRSSTASSSAVHSRREVRRQSAASRSPSNRASVTFVLPTSTASSMGARTLLGRTPQRSRFPVHGTSPGGDLSPARTPYEIALGDRRLRVPGGGKLAIPNLAADLLVGPAERRT